jgi:quercetin dioxygenase-like cupin family protein
MRACVIRPGDAETLSVRGNTLVFLVDAADTDGACGLVDYTAAPASPGPPAHVHDAMVDTFFVLEGELAMRVGDETIAAPAGTYVVVPPRVVHAFANPADTPARFLSMHVPGGFEQYFRDLAGGAVLAPGAYDYREPTPADARTGAFVTGPGGGTPIGHQGLRVRTGGEETGERFALLEFVAAPRSQGPPRHVHRSHDEAFYVLSGTLTVEAEGELHDVAAGGFAWAPRGVTHTFENRGDEPAHYLGLCFPAGIERMLAELATVTSREQIAEIAARYDTQFA